MIIQLCHYINAKQHAVLSKVLMSQLGTSHGPAHTFAQNTLSLSVVQHEAVVL